MSERKKSVEEGNKGDRTLQGDEDSLTVSVEGESVHVAVHAANHVA